MQVWAELTKERVADFFDDTGNNISSKNINYCELTALYWIWKNILSVGHDGDVFDYYGLFHYRRILDITEDDLYRMKANEVDVILQFPTFHETDIGGHHTRYIKESDWETMLHVIRELQPEYASVFQEIFMQPYFYNYNLIIAKRNVLEDYCAWFFPILERTELLSEPKGEYQDRYIGYLGENLMALYFLYHQKDLKIYIQGV